jgi:hypothetical protein
MKFVFVWTLRDIVGASLLSLFLLFLAGIAAWELGKYLWKRWIRPFFSFLYTIIVIVLFAGGCAGASGPHQHVGLKNFENRDRCELRDVYIWYSLDWELK